MTGKPEECEPVATLRQELDLLSHERIADAVHAGTMKTAVHPETWQAAVKHGGSYLIDVFKRVIGGVLMLAIAIGIVGLVLRYSIQAGWLK